MHGPILWKNLMKRPLGDYGICIKYLWHISYAIKVWHNVVLKGSFMGIMLGWWTMEILHELHYSSMGFYFMGSGGHGGTLISLGKM